MFSLEDLLMPLNRWADFNLKQYFNWSIVGILLTALGTAGYTILDSRALGIISKTMPEIARSIASISYYSFRSVVLAATLWVICLCRKDCRSTLRTYVQQRNIMPLLAEIIASGTYISVLFAMNYVTNVSYVQVFRQLGVPLGMVGGGIFLKECSAAVK